jgi:proline iminopeptidase
MEAASDFSLFPPLEARRTGMLAVDPPHALYWEESGNPDGIPVVYVHGGPGGGASPEKRCWFDPDAYRIILFDQRGAFRSTPLAEVQANTTQLLVEDMEKLRKMLGVERWLLAGGSWGTTLALAYGQTYPDACLGFLLRGIFLGGQAEIDWFLYHMGNFYPWAYDEFINWLPASERSDLLSAYEQRLFGDDADLRMAAARRWFRYTESCSLMRYDPELVEQSSKNDTVVIGVGRLDAFYFRNRMFLPENGLLQALGKIDHLPLMIIQGGHDVIAPPVAAYRLHRMWRNSILHLVPDAGHAPSEPGIRIAAIQALEQFKRQMRFTSLGNTSPTG